MAFKSKASDRRGQVPLWRFQFTLKTLLLLFVATGLLLGRVCQRARQQCAIARFIEIAGGSVQYDNDVPKYSTYGYGRHGPMAPTVKNWPGKARLRTLLGRDYVDDVVTVSFPFTATITDDDLGKLAGLRSLVYLEVQSIHVTDAGLIRLRAMTWLKDLSLCSPNLTDDAVYSLQRCLRDTHIVVRPFTSGTE